MINEKEKKMSGFEEILKQKTDKAVERPAPSPLTILTDMNVSSTSIQAYADKANDLMVQVGDIMVKTTDDQNNAVSIDGKIGKLLKALETEKKATTAEARAFVQAINNDAKKISEPLSKARADLKNKMRQFAAFLEAERRKQQKAIDEANKKLQEQLDEEAKKSGIEAPKVAPIAPSLPSKTVGRGADGSASYEKRTWKGELINPDEVPREYCLPDMRKINEAVKAGIRTISGVKIFEDVQIITRS